MRWTLRNPDLVAAALAAHLGLTLAAVLLALLVAAPLGLWAARDPRAGAVLLPLAGVAYALPTLAVFALLLPFLGLGFATALAGLVAAAAPLLLRAVADGLRSVPATPLDAAVGLGMTPLQRLLRVELPLAAPVLVSGLRLAVVTVVSAATVAAYVGGGGLGVLILTGLDQGHAEKVLVGSGLAALLALAADRLLRRAEQRLAGGSAAGCAPS